MLNQLFNQGGHSEEYKGKMRKKSKLISNFLRLVSQILQESSIPFGLVPYTFELKLIIKLKFALVHLNCETFM